VTGCLFFLAIGLMLVQGQQVAHVPNGLPAGSMAALVLAVLAIIARTILPPWLAKVNREKIFSRIDMQEPVERQPLGLRRESLASMISPADLWSTYVGRIIASVAPLEFAVAGVLVAYLVDHAAWAPAVAAILTIVIALHFPTHRRAIAWADQQIRLLATEHDLS
jgi:hypothetical protein